MVITVLLIFSLVLIVTGVAGFLIPPGKALMSGVSAYNIFHIVFGILGLITAWFGGATHARMFLVGFGAVDLYQAVASFINWFPKQYFRWTRADDILHIVIGAALVAVGFLL